MDWVEYGSAMAYIRHRARVWPTPTAFHADSFYRAVPRDQLQPQMFVGPPEHAIEKLKAMPNILAVIPQEIPEAPYTPLECALNGIPFLASNVGAVASQIAPADRARVLYDPAKPEALAALIADAIRSTTAPPRPAFDPVSNGLAWLDWYEFMADEGIRKLVAERAKPVHAFHSLNERDALPLVSIVTTTFNRYQYLDTVIASVEAQDYPQDRIEYIISDDGSTDAEHLRDLDTRWRDFAFKGWKIVHGDNCAMGCSRNRGASHARGKYVLFVDDDDYLKPKAISTLVRAMEVGAADVLAVFYELFTEEYGPPDLSAHPKYALGFPGGSYDAGLFENIWSAGTTMVRRDVFTAIGGFPVDRFGGEDFTMVNRAAVRGYRCMTLPEPLLLHRLSTPGSVTKDARFLGVGDSLENKLAKQIGTKLMSVKPFVEALPEVMHDVVVDALIPRDDRTGRVLLDPKGGSNYPLWQ